MLEPSRRPLLSKPKLAAMLLSRSHPLAPADPAAAGQDLAARCDAARRWGRERLHVQAASTCDILIVPLRPVTGSLSSAAQPGDPVRLGVSWVDATSGDAGAVLPAPPGLPSVSDLRARARWVREGNAVPTLAAVDLAERQMVAGGYVAPVRRRMITQPVATYSLIGFLVAVYIIEQASITFAEAWALPAREWQWWQLVTSAMIHDPSSYAHIVFNSLALLFIGRLVEQLYGRLVLVGTFIVTAVAGNLLWLAATGVGISPAGEAGGIAVSLGASGGISGLVGLLLVLGRVQGKQVPVGIAQNVRNYALIVIALNVAFGFFGSQLLGGAGSVVNNYAHAGGLIAGALIGLLIPPLAGIGGRDLSVAERVALGVAIAVAALALVVGLVNYLSVAGAGGAAAAP